MSMTNEAKLEQAARHVREYGLGDNNQAWMHLFDGLVDSLKEDLMHASPDAVPALQAQARQLRALQDVVISQVPTNGRA